MKRIMQKNKWLCGAVILTFVFAASVSHAQNFTGMADLPVTEDTATVLGEDPTSTLPPSAEPKTESPLLDYPLQDDSTYTLGVHDVITINVMRHPEVSGEYPINKEGKIQYEFVGDIPVVGLTKGELKTKLSELLSEYVIDPELNIKITGYNSKVVFVIGEVAHPGKIFMRGDTITVHEALVQSGLPLLSASTKKCRLITPSKEGKPKIKYVNVFNLLYEGDLRENIVMKPGDTLYIPATIMAKALRVIQPIAQPISAAGAAARPAVTGGF